MADETNPLDPLILSYQDLKLALNKGQIKFSPDISEDQVGISSIDLRLGYEFTRLKENPGLVVRPAADGFNPTDIVEHENLENKNVDDIISCDEGPVLALLQLLVEA